jgi:hypothetical protein
VVLALPVRELHPHPLITHNSMTHTAVVKESLPLRALHTAEAMSVHFSLAVARVVVFFFTLYIC